MSTSPVTLCHEYKVLRELHQTSPATAAGRFRDAARRLARLLRETGPLRAYGLVFALHQGEVHAVPESLLDGLASARYAADLDGPEVFRVTTRDEPLAVAAADFALPDDDVA